MFCQYLKKLFESEAQIRINQLKQDPRPLPLDPEYYEATYAKFNKYYELVKYLDRLEKDSAKTLVESYGTSWKPVCNGYTTYATCV